MGIRKLPSGRYQLTHTLDGRKKRESFDTKKEAQQFEANLKLRNFTNHVLVRIDVNDAVAAYKASMRKGYNHVYEKAFERFADHYAGCAVGEIKRSHMIELRERLQTVLGDSSVNLYMRIYKGFFKYCLNREWTNQVNVMSLDALPAESEKKKLWLEWQQKAFIQSFGGVMRESLYYFWLTGIRPTSIFRHTWLDFHQETKRIKAVSYKSRGGKKVETIHHLADDVVQFLIAKRTQDISQGFGRHFDPIFHVNGKPWMASAFTSNAYMKLKTFQKRDPSFDGLCVYAFRHTWVSNVGDAHGIHKASQAIGHKSVVTTERFYYQGDNELVARAVRETVGDVSTPFKEIGKRSRVEKLVGT